MSNKKGKIVTAMILVSIMAVISCTHSPQEPEVSFSKDIIPIFTASCVLNSGCHLGANSTNQEVALDSSEAYNCIIAKRLVSTSAPAESLLYSEVYTTTGSADMPKPPSPPLSAAQQALIINWIQQGAKNN